MSGFGLGGWTAPSTTTEQGHHKADPASLRRLFASTSTSPPSSSPTSAATAADAVGDDKGGKPKLQRQQSWPDKYNEALEEDVRDSSARSVQHFNTTSQPHPFQTKTKTKYWSNPTVNHAWSEEEVQDRLETSSQHFKPETVSDRVVYGFVRSLYHTANVLMRYDRKNPSVRSCEFRLIFLESVAGCPGMVAASLRHFRSLRTLQRDHGWIHTLLEEAENERMHLLVCLKMFGAGPITRGFVTVAQGVFVGLLTAMYLVHPPSLHRFVGYLEETACDTYAHLLHRMDEPGTHIHQAWSDLKAPPIAKGYWRLGEDASWRDVLEQIYADESHHRDVNHSFACIGPYSTNPYVTKHLSDAEMFWQLPKEEREKVKAGSVSL